MSEEIADEVSKDVSSAPARTPLKRWWAIIRRVYVMNDFHNLPLLAAGVAFFAFLAFVPLIAVTVLLYGLIGDPKAVSASLDLLSGFAPPEVLTILREQLLQIVTTSKAAQGIGLAVALLLSTYGAMRAASAIMKALNIIYGEYESRNILITTGVAASITLGMVGVALIGVSAISVFSYIRNFLSDYLGSSTLTLVQILTWVVAGSLVSFTFAIFFRFAPDRHVAKWRWLSLGSIVSTFLWVAVTLGFGFYVSNVSDYNATYGSLAAVVIFLMWLFLSAYAVLIGAEINAATERQAVRDRAADLDRPLGHRGAVMAENVALDQASKQVLEKRQRRRANRAARKASKSGRAT